jgi:hypothetical protein
MDPKPDSSQPTEIEVEAQAQPQKRPQTLGRMNIKKMTPEELAERRKADEEEEAKRREARMRPKSGGVPPAASPAPPPTAPASAAHPPEPPPSAPTAPETPMPEITAEVVSPFASASGPVFMVLTEAAVGLLGAEAKHVGALCSLAEKLARQLGAEPMAIDLIPCAVQSLYIASQLDRRGPYAPPELATLQKLLGDTWVLVGPMVEPCAKGGLAKAKFERKDAAAIAAVMSFFNQTRNPVPPAQTTKMALATLRGQKFIPADALDALAAAIAG